MIILGIETSCDETGVCLMKHAAEAPAILAEEISSQVDLHKEYGGVVPELAAREHLKNLPILVEKICSDAKHSLDDVDLIAVTQGPGLKGCLLMGLSFALGLKRVINKPLVGINHIEGHILAPFIGEKEVTFPFLALVVSGGHTEIVAVHALGNYKVVSRTIDDAAGEAFDKSAFLLGFDYPGGAALARVADSCKQSDFELPEVMRDSDDFSFSGLKTAISLLIKKQSSVLENGQVRSQVAKTIQDSIVSSLVRKLEKAVHKTEIRNVVITGGVAANISLRERVKKVRERASIYSFLTRCC